MDRKRLVMNVTKNELELLEYILQEAHTWPYDTEEDVEAAWKLYRAVLKSKDLTVKNIIFDLGGVLLTYNTPDFICKYGVSREEAEIFIDAILWCENNRWHEMDLGILSAQELMEYYINRFPSCENAARIFFAHMDEWYSDNSETWNLLPKLRKKGYRCYLLSNCYQELYKNCISKMPFMSDISGAVISGYEGVGKPDETIYKILLHRYELDPYECIFFDDQIRNTMAGELLGIKGFAVSSQEELRKNLNELIER